MFAWPTDLEAEEQLIHAWYAGQLWKNTVEISSIVEWSMLNLNITNKLQKEWMVATDVETTAGLVSTI